MIITVNTSVTGCAISIFLTFLCEAVPGLDGAFSVGCSHVDTDRQHTMSEQKSHQFRPPLYKKDGASSEDSSRNVGESGNDQHGWDAYRKWLSRVSTKPAGERAPLDHSIYSWRGYHTWADKIRQTWKSES